MFQCWGIPGGNVSVAGGVTQVSPVASRAVWLVARAVWLVARGSGCVAQAGGWGCVARGSWLVVQAVRLRLVAGAGRGGCRAVLLSSSSAGTRCAARPPMPPVTCPSSAAAPRPPAPLTCTCRMGTTAARAPATATRDAASPQTCSARSSTGEVPGCAGWGRGGHSTRMLSLYLHPPVPQSWGAGGHLERRHSFREAFQALLTECPSASLVTVERTKSKLVSVGKFNQRISPFATPLLISEGRDCWGFGQG